MGVLSGILGGGKKEKAPEAPAQPPPVTRPAEVDGPDAEAVKNAKDRALDEKSRRGRNKLMIPLGGTSGGSGLSIPLM